MFFKSERCNDIELFIEYAVSGAVGFVGSLAAGAVYDFLKNTTSLTTFLRIRI